MAVKSSKKNTQKNKGVKHSQDKIQPFTVLTTQFPLAFKAIVQRSGLGHKKYLEADKDWCNWSRVENGYSEYSNALMRHLMGEGEDSELEHDIAVAWNAIARLELRLRKEQENVKKA